MIHEIERNVMNLLLQRFHGELANSVPQFGMEFFQGLAEDIVAEVLDYGQYANYPRCDCGCTEEEDHEDEHDDVWLAIDELMQRVEALEASPVDETEEYPSSVYRTVIVPTEGTNTDPYFSNYRQW